MVRAPEPEVGVTSRRLSEAWFGIGKPARVDVNTPCSRAGSGAGRAEAPPPEAVPPLGRPGQLGKRERKQSMQRGPRFGHYIVNSLLTQVKGSGLSTWQGMGHSRGRAHMQKRAPRVLGNNLPKLARAMTVLTTRHTTAVYSNHRVVGSPSSIPTPAPPPGGLLLGLPTPSHTTNPYEQDAQPRDGLVSRARARLDSSAAWWEGVVTLQSLCHPPARNPVSRTELLRVTFKALSPPTFPCLSLSP